MTGKNNNNLIIGILAVAAILIVLGIFGSGFGSYGMMEGYSSGFMSFGWIFNVLVIILIIAGIYWLIKNANHNERR